MLRPQAIGHRYGPQAWAIGDGPEQEAIPMNDEPLKTATAGNADASAVESLAGCAEEAFTDAPTDPPAGPAPKPGKAEFGGPKGLEPTRYGDWERNGRCYDF